MKTQPEALRIATWLEETVPGVEVSPMETKAAAELRRLHEANQAMLEALKDIAYRSMSMYGSYSHMIENLQETARAAIAKGEQQ